MSYLVLQPLTLKTARGKIELEPGQTIIVEDDKALSLMQAGKIELADPAQQYNYEERAAIMQHDAGLPREEAEQFSWCKHACMVSSGQAKGMLPDHSDGCKVKTPCPKYTRNAYSWRAI